MSLDMRHRKTRSSDLPLPIERDCLLARAWLKLRLDHRVTGPLQTSVDRYYLGGGFVEQEDVGGDNALRWRAAASRSWLNQVQLFKASLSRGVR
jgi:hypothetical protein